MDIPCHRFSFHLLTQIIVLDVFALYGGEKGVSMKIKDIMTKDLFFLKSNRKISKVEEVMDWFDIRHVLITDESNKLLGVISQRDLFRTFIGNMTEIDDKKFIDQINVTDLMTKNPYTTTPNVSIRHAAKLMTKNKISCLPVLDRNKKVIGIVTDTDIVRSCGR